MRIGTSALAKVFTACVFCLSCTLWLACFGGQAVAQKKAQETVLSAWMGEHETFIAWYAKQKGWDSEEGFTLTMLPFDSGKDIVQNLAAYSWDAAGCGAVPALTTPLGEYLDIVAVAGDESASIALYGRAASPMTTITNASPAFPKVRGNAETVRGAEILYPEGTSAHYLLAVWLKALGLTKADVKLSPMPLEAALSAFKGGVGDVLAVWAPLTYEAEAAGFVPLATGPECGLRQYIFLTLTKDFAARKPETARAFVRMYLRGVAALRAAAPESLVPNYMSFHKEWSGRSMTPENALRDLKDHKIFTAQEQLELFKADGEASLALRRTADFLIRNSLAAPDAAHRLPAGSGINTTVLQELAR